MGKGQAYENNQSKDSNTPDSLHDSFVSYMRRLKLSWSNGCGE